MKIINPFLFAMLTSLSLGALPVHAQNAAPTESQPAAKDAEADRFYGAMQERYQLMHDQMQKIRQAKDPAERQKLLQEHWQTLHGGMGVMGGGYSMGPGAMRGHGMQPGMMMGGSSGMGGGYGMRGGMVPGMAMGPQIPSLSAEQQSKIAAIRDDTRKKHWQLMGTIMDEQSRLRVLRDTPQLDTAAINDAYGKISGLQQQMHETAVDAHKRIGDVLTEEQKAGLLRYWQQGR